MRRKSLAIVLSVLLLLVAACGRKGMQQGQWEADVFTNAWAGLQFTLAEGCASLGPAQMQEWAQNPQAAYNDSAQKLELDEVGLYYDCIVLLGKEKCSVQIIYENMQALPDMHETDYAEVLKTGFSALTAAEYAYIEEEEVTIAGQRYFCHTWEVNEEVIQRVYLRRVEEAMICIATSCPEKETEVIDAFLESMIDPNAKA